MIFATGAAQAAPPALAGQVPFSAPFEITNSVAGARSAIAVDIDGDGDLDVVGASYDVTGR